MIWIFYFCIFFGAGFECRLLFLLMCTFNKWMLIVLDLFFKFLTRWNWITFVEHFFFFICSSSRISLELLVHKQLLLFSLSLILPFFSLQINNYFALDHLLLYALCIQFQSICCTFSFQIQIYFIILFFGETNESSLQLTCVENSLISLFYS